MIKESYSYKMTLGLHSGKPGTGKGELCSPHGMITTPAGQLLVVEGGNERVQVFDSNYRFVQFIGRKAKKRTDLSDGCFYYPTAVACTSKGDVIVTDTGHRRIQIFHPDGKFKHKFGESPGLECPYDIVLDKEENIIISDLYAMMVKAFTQEGVPLREFGIPLQNRGSSMILAMNPVGHLLVYYSAEAPDETFALEVFDKEEKLGPWGNPEDFKDRGLFVMDVTGRMATVNSKTKVLSIYSKEGEVVTSVSLQEHFGKEAGWMGLGPNGDLLVADYHLIKVFGSLRE